MAVWIWLGIGLLVALILLVAWAADRRSERREHHVRSVKDLSRDLGEQDRDNRLRDAQGMSTRVGPGSIGRADPTTAPTEARPFR